MDRVKKVKEYTEKALKDFLKNDAKDLLKNRPNETTFSAKIAMYLHNYIVADKENFDRISVDCEYNKLKGNLKTPPESYPYKSIRPDIVVHQRGTCNQNLLFCELKVKNLSHNDIEKVNFAIGEPLNYRVGLLIHTIRESSLLVRWVHKVEDANNDKLDNKITITEDKNNGKLKMYTPNKANENFEKLAAMFPNAVTESANENGKVIPKTRNSH